MEVVTPRVRARVELEVINLQEGMVGELDDRCNVIEWTT